MTMLYNKEKRTKKAILDPIASLKALIKTAKSRGLSSNFNSMALLPNNKENHVLQTVYLSNKLT